MIIVDARAGQSALSGVYKEAHSFGPTLVVIEDIDLIVEIGHPGRAAAAKILSRYLHGVPGGDDVELDLVAAQFGADMSGADIREVVRRTVLAGSGRVSTTDLVTTV